MSTLKAPVAAVFAPLLEEKRYKVAFGGRASGKSWFFAEELILRAIENPKLRAVCIREVQKSLNQSVKRLLEDRIEFFDLGRYFDIQKAEIHILDRHGKRQGLIIFQGMQNHTADSIKSLEGYDIAFIEEAQTLSQRSLDLLRPTMRKPGSEIWVAFNPRFPTDPIDKFFRCNDEESKEKGAKPPANSAIISVNYWDNPYVDPIIIEEMEYDKRRDPDKYQHVWCGGYEARGEARVFHNWQIDEYETPSDARFYYGLDFGFSVDPNAFVRCFFGRFEGGKAIADPKGRNLFIDYEAYEHGCTIERTPTMLKRIPEATHWPIRADNARPETIDYLRRNGFPKIISSTKGANSIVDGVEFIKSFDVIIHPRCKHVIDNFTHYRYEIDKQTEEILPKLQDANCDCIDALRYALELERKATRQRGQVSFFGPKSLDD